MINFLESKEDINAKKSCKGLFWRAEVTSYCYEDRIGVKKTLRLLKRKSCKGCEHCGWVNDFLHEDICNNPNEDYLADIEHGKIYTYSPISSQGYYDQYPELERIDFIEVKEKDDDKNQQ